MIWDSIIIGKGNQGNSWLKLLNYNNISDNKVTYYIRGGLLFDASLIVFKDTPQGKKLTKLIENGATELSIQNIANDWFLDRVSRKVLKKEIHLALQSAFEDGRIAKAKEIRKVLNINS